MSAYREALARIGGLSNPSKMPSWGYSIPPRKCAVGQRLALIAGSTCEICYAMKGRYVMPCVEAAMERRLSCLEAGLDDWADAFILVLNHQLEAWKKAEDKRQAWHPPLARPMDSAKDCRYFRWHDAGDIQSEDHLLAIFTIALNCPGVSFWLPTREYQLVKAVCREYEVPANLTIRMSAHMRDRPAPDFGLPTSTVHENSPPIGQGCPAPGNGQLVKRKGQWKRETGFCGCCRACWNSAVPNISYHNH